MPTEYTKNHSVTESPGQSVILSLASNILLRMHKLTVYIPESHLESVKDALFAAGAGQYKNYDRCCWQGLGEGQFRPLAGSNPFLGDQGAEEHFFEYRVEMICRDEALSSVTAALKKSHPYEEPAYDFVKIED